MAAHDLEEVLAAEPVRGREALRGVFQNGRIEMHPGDDGTYRAQATFLPLVAVAANEHDAPTRNQPLAVPFDVLVPKPEDRRRKKPAR